jgi:hypothetical protein
MRRLVLISAAAMLVAGSASAQPQQFQNRAPEPSTNPSTTADQMSGSDPDKVICKNVKPPTGTRIGSARNRQRICQTKADWEQQELEAQEAARTARGNGQFSATNENGSGS